LYTDHWHLNRKPFENAPDPDFLFYSNEHKEALYRLTYAIQERKGGALLTGEYGCGKTTLIRAVVRNVKTVKPDDYAIAVVNNPRLDHIELLNEILYQLGSDQQSNSHLELSRVLGDILYDNASQGKHTLLVVDEAQLIRDDAAMEELRLLLNYQLEDKFLITLLLAGQPELRERIKELPQFEQRVAVRYHLHTLSAEDTANYVYHRMRVAGATNAVFTPEAVQLVFKASLGVPRRINNVCDLCLLEGYRKSADKVGEDVVKQVT